MFQDMFKQKDCRAEWSRKLYEIIISAPVCSSLPSHFITMITDCWVVKAFLTEDLSMLWTDCIMLWITKRNSLSRTSSESFCIQSSVFLYGNRGQNYACAICCSTRWSCINPHILWYDSSQNRAGIQDIHASGIERLNGECRCSATPVAELTF